MPPYVIEPGDMDWIAGVVREILDL
jgi:hypothetical protein